MKAEDIVAQRILESVKEDLKKELASMTECNTAECQRIKAQYEKAIADNDAAMLKKIDKLDADIVQMVEDLEKHYTQQAQQGAVACPHCGFDEDEKPKTVGRCPDGHCDFDEYDKKIGMQKCTICGEDIEWD